MYQSSRLGRVAIADSITPETDSRVILLLGDSRVAQWNPMPEVAGFHVINSGVSGSCSVDLLVQLVHADSFDGINLAVIQIGINDLKVIGLYPDRSAEIMSNFQKNMTKTIEILSKNGVKVFLVPVIPSGDLGLKRAVWSKNVDEAINEANNFFDSAFQDHVQIADISSMLDGDGKLKAMFQADSIHLNESGYSHLNGIILPIITEMTQLPIK